MIPTGAARSKQPVRSSTTTIDSTLASCSRSSAARGPSRRSTRTRQAAVTGLPAASAHDGLREPVAPPRLSPVSVGARHPPAGDGAGGRSRRSSGADESTEQHVPASSAGRGGEPAMAILVPGTRKTAPWLGLHGERPVRPVRPGPAGHRHRIVHRRRRRAAVARNPGKTKFELPRNRLSQARRHGGRQELALLASTRLPSQLTRQGSDLEAVAVLHQNVRAAPDADLRSTTSSVLPPVFSFIARRTRGTVLGAAAQRGQADIVAPQHQDRFVCRAQVAVGGSSRPLDRHEPARPALSAAV